MKKKPKSAGTILERECETAIKEWLRRVNLLPELTCISLSDGDRTLHLPKLYQDLACRLRLAKNAYLPISTDATEHGQMRRLQGYSPAMLVEESRLFQVVTFQALHCHRGELDQDRLLLDVALIADEVDLQLMQAVSCWQAQITQPVDAFLPPPCVGRNSKLVQFSSVLKSSSGISLQAMTPEADETFTRKEIQDRFEKLFGRKMTASERACFFLPPDEEGAGDPHDRPSLMRIE
jgi:hypothetical protein